MATMRISDVEATQGPFSALFLFYLMTRSQLHRLALNGCAIVNYKFDTLCKKAVVAYLKVHCLGESKENERLYLDIR
jgi:hypothetical protein